MPGVPMRNPGARSHRDFSVLIRSLGIVTAPTAEKDRDVLRWRSVALSEGSRPRYRDLSDKIE